MLGNFDIELTDMEKTSKKLLMKKTKLIDLMSEEEIKQAKEIAEENFQKFLKEHEGDPSLDTNKEVPEIAKGSEENN
jgi:hypothetical protein